MSTSTSLKVCLATTIFPRASDDIRGIFIYRSARALQRAGVQVSVVAPGDGGLPDFEEMDGIKVFRFSYWYPRNLQCLAYRDGIVANVRRHKIALLQVPAFLLCFLAKVIRVSRDCDVIHAYWTPSALAALAANALTRNHIPIALTPLGTDLRSLPRRFSQFVIRRVGAVVSPGLDVEAMLRDLGTTCYHTIPLVAGEDEFRRGIDNLYLRKELSLVDGEPVVTFVGRLQDFKDPLTFVRAVPLVLAECPQVRFLLVGYGPLHDAAQSLIKELKVERSTSFLGGRRDINAILECSTLFAALSPVENIWSMSIVEAMFMGVPCIITRAGRTEELFTHRENAYLVEPRDETKLAEGIVHLLRDPSLRAKLSRGATDLLERHKCRSAQIVEAHLDLYGSLLARRHGR